MVKKFCRADEHIRIAIGVEFPNDSLPSVNAKIKGIAEIRPIFGTETTMVYLDLQGVESYPKQFQMTVPEIIRGAAHGGILFNKRPGALVLFGREGEEMPFGFSEGKYFISLRLYPKEKAPTSDWRFNPVYVRVDKGVETYFFVVRAKWEDNVITVEVDHSPGDNIPYFLW